MRASTRDNSINSIGSFSWMHGFSHKSCRNWLRISSTCFPCAKVMVFESSLTLVYRSRYFKMTRKLCTTGSSLSPMRNRRASCLRSAMACASAAAEGTWPWIVPSCSSSMIWTSLRPRMTRFSVVAAISSKMWFLSSPAIPSRVGVVGIVVATVFGVRVVGMC
jgi:hypothetical protein